MTIIYDMANGSTRFEQVQENGTRDAAPANGPATGLQLAPQAAHHRQHDQEQRLARQYFINRLLDRL